MVSFLGTKDSLRGRAAISNGVNGLSSDAAIHRLKIRCCRWVRRRRAYLSYMMIFLALFIFAISSMVMQTLIGSVFGSESLMVMRRLRLGSSLRFMRSYVQDDGLDRERSSKPRMALRALQIALENEYSTLVQIATK